MLLNSFFETKLKAISLTGQISKTYRKHHTLSMVTKGKNLMKNGTGKDET